MAIIITTIQSTGSKLVIGDATQLIPAVDWVELCLDKYFRGGGGHRAVNHQQISIINHPAR